MRFCTGNKTQEKPLLRKIFRGRGSFYEVCGRLRKPVQLRLPDGGAGVARHPPVAARGKRHGADLRPVREAAALELLLEEAAVEVFSQCSSTAFV